MPQKKMELMLVIASDHAAMNYAKKIGYPVHISTQCNISNIETVEFYANYADVMVMARELSLQQVGSIAQKLKEEKLKVLPVKMLRLKFLLMELYAWQFPVNVI